MYCVILMTKKKKVEAWKLFVKHPALESYDIYTLISLSLFENYRDLAWKLICSRNPTNNDLRRAVCYLQNEYKQKAWEMLLLRRVLPEDWAFIVKHASSLYNIKASEKLLTGFCKTEDLVVVICYSTSTNLVESAWQRFVNKCPTNEELRLIIRDAKNPVFQEKAWQKLLDQGGTFVDMKWIEYNAKLEYKEKAIIEYERMRKEACSKNPSSSID